MSIPQVHTRVLRLPEVVATVGLSRSSVYVMMRKGRFPLPIQIGERAVAWRQLDIDRWLSSRRTSAGLHDNQATAETTPVVPIKFSPDGE